MELKITSTLESYGNSWIQAIWMPCGPSLEGWGDKTRKSAELSLCPEQLILALYARYQLSAQRRSVMVMDVSMHIIELIATD